MIEREKTYLLNSLPQNLNEYFMQEIIDIYIPLRNGMAQLRARKKGDNYELTKKFPVQEGNNSIQNEHTIVIDQDEFDYLFSYLPYTIRKKRYSSKNINKNGTIIYDIDIFEGNLSGLMMADVEFDEGVDMDDFTPPSFLGKEVTQDRRFAGGVLAQMKKNGIKKIING